MYVASGRLVWNSVSFVSDDCLHSLSGIELVRFCSVMEEIDLQDFWRWCSSAVSVCGSGLAKQLVQPESSKCFQSETNLANLEANLLVECNVQRCISQAVTSLILLLQIILSVVRFKGVLVGRHQFWFCNDSIGFFFQCLDPFIDPHLTKTWFLFYHTVAIILLKLAS